MKGGRRSQYGKNRKKDEGTDRKGGGKKIKRI